MTITRVGSNEKYAAGWESAFGKGKPTKVKASSGKSSAKVGKGKKPSATKKAVAPKVVVKKAAKKAAKKVARK